MSGYCVEADLGYVANSAEILALADRDRDGSADTNVKQYFIDAASFLLESIAVSTRDEYAADTDLDAENYNTTTNPCPILRHMSAWLATDMMRDAFRRTGDPIVNATHYVLVWADQVAHSEKHLVKH